jgi:hypothetical protein
MSTCCGKRKLRELHQVLSCPATVATETAALRAAITRGAKRIRNSLFRGTDGDASLGTYGQVFQGFGRSRGVSNQGIRGISRMPRRWPHYRPRPYGRPFSSLSFGMAFGRICASRDRCRTSKRSAHREHPSIGCLPSSSFRSRRLWAPCRGDHRRRNGLGRFRPALC